jgi:hypothetical protein
MLLNLGGQHRLNGTSIARPAVMGTKCGNIDMILQSASQGMAPQLNVDIDLLMYFETYRKILIEDQ